MLDLRFIRDHPDQFDAGLARRGAEPQATSLLALDEAHRSCLTELQTKQARRNAVSKEIGEIKRNGGDASAEIAEMAALKTEVPALEDKARALEAELHDRLSGLPNLPAADTPDGPDESANVVVRQHLEPPRRNDIADHVALGAGGGRMDFEAAARLSGARFVVLRRDFARLERALGQFMLDLHTQQHGYTEISAPLLVREAALFGTGQLPKFAEDQFLTTDGYWLVPTAEVSLTNLAADAIHDLADLPMRFTALTPCFRSEAGAAGRDTRGMIRQHQFWKVELVSITAPEASEAEHERMTEAAETVLKLLEIPFRTVALCTGDLGFSARKTYDLEVWLPGQNAYREISSCSNCGDFQARRMKARFRAEGDKDTRFVHTLNGSGVAVGRCLVALLENHQQPDGGIAIPAPLQPYLGGQSLIPPEA